MSERVAHLITDPTELASVYRELLSPNFPDDELVGLDEFLHGTGTTDSVVLTLRDEDGRDVAVSVSSFDRESKVLLLVYLAVRPGIRGGGLGGALLRASQARWAEDFAPDFVVGEVERPGDRTTADEAHGDPEARLRFYRRFGALRVEAPFFQPGMHGPADRVPMYLMLLHVADGARLAEPAPGQVLVAAKPLHDFLVRYITDTEGEPPRDAMARALLEPLEGESVLAVLL